MCVHIILNFLFECDDLGLILDDFLLRILHDLISLHFFQNLLCFDLYGHTLFLDKLKTVMNKFVFPFLESGDVRLDVSVIEVGISSQYGLCLHSVLIYYIDFIKQVKLLLFLLRNLKLY